MYGTKDARHEAGLTELYFAYGSNMDEAQMRRRCPRARLVGAAVLRGHRLGFAGRSASWGGAVATVVRDGQGSVPGLVWALGAGDLACLDGFEGHPVAYRRRRLSVVCDDGRRRRAHVYVKEGAPAAPPTLAYFGVLFEAYRAWGFDPVGLRLALEVER